MKNEKFWKLLNESAKYAARLILAVAILIYVLKL